MAISRRLREICDLADEYGALVMVDDSHAVGFMGRSGRGTHEHCGVEGRVDILTGTLGKALGGASGGYASGRKEIIEYAPAALAAVPVFELRCSADCGGFAKGSGPAVCVAPVAGAASSEYALFPRRMQDSGFSIPPGEHPIVPVMIGDAVLADEWRIYCWSKAFT